MQSARLLVTFVRHGETYMNHQRLIQGHSDNALSEKGIEQAKQLGRYISNTTFTKAYSSDLQRAFNTAKLLLSQNTTTVPEVKQDSRLRERCYGDAEGKPVQDFIDWAAKSNTSIHDFVPNGAESTEELGRRAEDFFINVICRLSENSSSNENVLVVSHGGWIQGLMRHLHTNKTNYELQNFSPSQAIRIHYNTGVTVISISLQNQSSNCPKYEVKFLKINDISHLTPNEEM